MRAKIVSDGTRAGTKIVDAATGEAIDMHVLGLEWRIDRDDAAAICILKCRLVEADLEADAIVQPMRHKRNVRPAHTSRGEDAQVA
jgi:hypothetical protein